jgi:hypothetical protein
LTRLANAPTWNTNMEARISRNFAHPSALERVQWPRGTHELLEKPA